ncbi:MAG: outer membrane protein assembly factor BamE [Chthoniobacterales bacterium]|nr:outer membrane protein assembly factor BamE [Chthoniobacterales bacterium]
MSTRKAELALLCALIAPLVLAGCVGDRLRKANVDQVTNGMAKKQVESILGPPTSVTDIKDLDMTQKTTYVYVQGKDTVTIVFYDDKLESKLSTLTK